MRRGNSRKRGGGGYSDAVWYNYETEYDDGDGDLLQDNSLLDGSRYIRLVFLGNGGTPFTVLMTFVNNYSPVLKDNPCWKYPITFPPVPYSDLIGQEFAFKYNGESLPSALQSQTTAPLAVLRQ